MSGIASKVLPRTNNGTGAFVLQCRKMVFNYCEKWGSNKGMIEYIRKISPTLPRSILKLKLLFNLDLLIPIVRGYYLNGRDKVICTRNLTPAEINTKVELLRDSSGDKIKNLTKRPVISTTESVRGIWSPFNSNPHTI
ncbi:unnamed protein product [Mucor hiemalis]